MPRSNSSVDSPKKTKQKKLTDEEVLVLKSHLEEWKEAAANDRKKILKAVIKEAKVHAPAMDDRSLKNRKYTYRDWLYNRRPEKTREKKANKFGQKWTSRSVIEQLRKEEIIEKTGAMPGSKKFIERYQTTLTAVVASLSKEELEEAQNTAIEWSAKAPPAAVQADFAKKKAPGMMKDLATKLWKQAGMRIFILSAWKTEEDEVRINGIDFNEKLEGNSYTDTKDWKSMLSEWNAYAGEEFDVDLNNDDDDNEEEVKKSRKKGGKKDDYPLEVDSYGLPVIPDVTELNLESKKRLIRTFLTKHYRLCSQQPKASVPWASVRMAQGDFIAAKFLPTGWRLDDPSKIRLADADRLLELWCQRQKDQVRPTFEFKGWEGDDKTMREPAEIISGNGSDARPRVPVKKSTGRRTRGVEPVSSSEDKDKDDEDEEKDDDHYYDDNLQSPPPITTTKVKIYQQSPTGQEIHTCPTTTFKGKTGQYEEEDTRLPVKKSILVQPPPSKAKRTNTVCRASTASEEEDTRPPVKKSILVPPPPSKSKRTNTVRRASTASEEEDTRQPVKKSIPVPPPPSKAKRTNTVRRASTASEEDTRPPVKKSIPVPQPTSKAKRTNTVRSTRPASEEEDTRPPVKRSIPVLPPPKLKSSQKRGRVAPIQSDLESDGPPPVKKSKLTASGRGQAEDNTSTGSAQSTGNDDNDPLPSQHLSRSRAFGPTSGVYAKNKTNKAPVHKPTPPAPRRDSGKKAKASEAQTTNPEPKRSHRSTKASYKAQYMQS
ncbi:uncharacterized protein HD556DRAFT_1305120 [Suillus plorans]|uniref:Uncharacterized protein n=1 Tax=Suillus plorans TaxID=116603 RepID=A0A9P7DQ21_9AGAM|nr:uncharacterized protein HD556DRAFT_1305120 [Suillus plorans]KAG1800350.1 hypothetical protein HD556DRAFT_1305120 [Suillus plorans]